MTDNLLLIFGKWFFTVAPRGILNIGENYALWAWKFFSVGYFLPRIFSPWHRDITGYGRGFDLRRFLRVWGWNFFSRIIGAILRIVVMAAGLAVILFFSIATIIGFTLWLFLPVLVPALLVIGTFTLFL